MWRVDGKTNAVYLLGSVHLLRASDHPFPSAFDSAAELIRVDDIAAAVAWLRASSPVHGPGYNS